MKWILCPYDEFAVEEAIRFKEKNPKLFATIQGQLGAISYFNAGLISEWTVFQGGRNKALKEAAKASGEAAKAHIETVKNLERQHLLKAIRQVKKLNKKLVSFRRCGNRPLLTHQHDWRSSYEPPVRGHRHVRWQYRQAG